RTDHQTGGGSRKVARPQEGRRENAFRHAVQNRARRYFLRQEGRHHETRLCDVHLEKGSQRKDHVCRMPWLRLHQGQVVSRTESASPAIGGLSFFTRSFQEPETFRAAIRSSG